MRGMSHTQGEILTDVRADHAVSFHSGSGNRETRVPLVHVPVPLFAVSPLAAKARPARATTGGPVTDRLVADASPVERSR
ncbi:hypothetical protein FrEUN1fDRAFT_1931 [Parafrankia sp. EUN1f]|nr:hypothetical protein FrEUN1fDRAFT_1931 [Parafrankia sp. EUN1f]